MTVLQKTEQVKLKEEIKERGDIRHVRTPEVADFRCPCLIAATAADHSLFTLFRFLVPRLIFDVHCDANYSILMELRYN